MIVVPDFRVLAQINISDPLKRKTTHRWPAGTTDAGYFCGSKMVVGSVHSVFERAPHGRYGNKYEPPYFSVKIDEMWPTFPYEWTDEDMLDEGFENVEAYGQWWDVWRVGDKHCKLWAEMENEPFWACRFHVVGITPHFHRRLELYDPRRETRPVRRGRGRRLPSY